jgi:glycosyltransferase involved in cell wall biosynthesis
MYLGTPVIATAAAGNLDLINSGENGLLFNDGDLPTLAAAIKSVKNNIQLRQKLIAGGNTTASDTFSIHRTIQNYEKLFQQLLTSRKF